MKPSTQPWKSVWFWLAIAAVLAVAAFMVFSPTFKGWVEGVADWAEGIIQENAVLGALVFFMLSAVSALVAFASSVLLVPPANEVWGRPVTFLLLWGGWTAGAIVAYLIGRFARPLLTKVVDAKLLKKYEQLAGKHMTFWAAILLCLAIPSEIPGYLFGALHYPFLKFLLAFAIAEAVYAAGIVIAGESLLEAEPVTLIAIGAAMVAVAVGAWFLLRAQRKRAK